MELLQQGLDIFLHLDLHLNQWAAALGPGLYVVLFLIVFCETGLVITPYLPGDSLLFAVGALSATEGSPIRLPQVMVLLAVAAILGDAVNYAAGFWIGPKVFNKEDSWLFDRRHLLRARRFYERHGGKTIILARFIPIIRTFAPFVAGIGKMSYPRFALYNVTGGVAWTVIFLGAGYKFANLPAVKKHFHFVILAIVVISAIPVVVELVKARYCPEPEEASTRTAAGPSRADHSI
ncbi:MAG: DedA family protein [Elusimicrobia bacterium]|nr:DedA family protein [Elusimicrobiota bacterium]